MNKKLSRLKYWSSFIYPVRLISKQGASLPKIEVNIRNGKYVLDGEKVNYSFGSLHTIFRRVFNEFGINKKPIETVLILGFGAGSVASILKNEFNLKCKVTGVEMDSMVLEIAKKYFGSNKLTDTTILCQDALSFLKNDTNQYDLIVVDLFIEERVPIQFTKKEFIHLLNTHLNSNGYLFYNRINSNPFTINETSILLDTMKDEFKSELFNYKFDYHNSSNSVLVFHKSASESANGKTKIKTEKNEHLLEKYA